ncbi:hypothetical protein QOZ80_2AG0134470 [Eleusine coracana subsp. coracana]|nr:hypothetical protein QOZ80_2AG0134470 [Eleusine coracana subsp. coracana]
MLIPAPPAAAPLSSLYSLSSQHFLLPAQFLPPGGNGGRPLRRGDLAIRMGGGPRTYPGGVSKWQWKRMQAKKAQQLLKARLARERQLFEMRKRAELRDAVAHLERPWDPDSSSAAAEAAPTLLSVAADDQLKALADRFHRPGGVDLWNDRDGPRVFESRASGAASARFFPKNAVHSFQPYALRGAVDEAGAPPVTRANAADVLLALGGQSVRENAPEEEAYINGGDGPPAVEFMERDGAWEPLHALNGGDDNNLADWSWDEDDDNVAYEAEGTGSMVRRNGRNAVERWEAANSMAVGRDNDTSWSGDAFFSDTEGAPQGHSDQRWQQRSRGARKHAGARWNALDTMSGGGTRERDQTVAGSISDSEMIQNGSVPKWRTRSKDGTRRGTGRRSVPGEDWVSDGFNSNSDSARGSKLEPSWGAQNKLNGRGNFRNKFKPKVNGNVSNGDAPRRHTRSNNADEHASSNNGDGRHRFGGGFPKDLEAPTWKPRRMNRARNNNSAREDKLGGTFRRVDNGGPRQLQDNPRNTNKEGGRRTGRNGGRQFRGGDYSLRPTSKLPSFWEEGSD